MSSISSIKQTSVFVGDELQTTPPLIDQPNARCFLHGVGPNKSGVHIPLSDDLLSKHILFIGSIGTGKSNGIFQVTSQLRDHMTPNDVMLIFDTKGDFYNDFYRKGDIVISNDDKATGANGADYWNIFSETGGEQSTEEEVIEIARSLFLERCQKSSQPFFPNAARDLFTGILLHFLRSEPEKNNASLRKFLNHVQPADIRTLLMKHPDLQSMVSYISDDRSPQTQGVISELQQHIREIFTGNFNQPGTLSIRETVKQKGGKLIFVEYDLAYGGMLTPIYRLLLDAAIKEALGRKKSEGNVWFIIDEFRLIPNLQHIDDGVNFGRGLGTKFIIGVQNIEQVYSSYGEAQARNILSGFSTTVAFHVNDSATRNYIQQLFGRNRKKEVYMQTVQSRGILEEVREANVVEDWDISNLKVGDAIIRIPEHQPFLFKFSKFN